MSESLRLRTVAALVAPAVMSMSLLFDATASAQYPDPAGRRWLVIDLGEMPECTEDHRGMFFGHGLNDFGDVVGFATDASWGCPDTAWVWSLCGRFDLPPEQMTSLATMVPTSVKTDANKISSAGVVAGTIYESWVGDDQPFVWELSTLSGGIANTVQIAASGDYGGDAYDVSDASPAVITGTIRDSGFVLRGFHHELGDPGTTRTLLSSGVSGEDGSYARGAAVSSSGDTLVSGQWWVDPMFGEQCYGQYNGLGWTVAGSTSTSTLREDFSSSGTPDLTLWEAQARAVNAGSERGGEYRDHETDCVRRAVHWTAAGVASDLGLISPLTSSDETTVNAMTDADANGGVMLVGDNTFYGYGLIWWRGSSSGAFSATRSYDLCIRPSGWTFTNFDDVNVNGWIVGTGFSPDYSNPRAFLLVPDGCPGDLDFDRDTDAADLAILLGAWGTPAGDLDCSGNTDATDLAILLGAWGTCNFCSENSSFAASASSSESELGSALEDALALFGQEDVASFSAWLDGLEPEARANVLQTLYTMLSP